MRFRLAFFFVLVVQLAAGFRHALPLRQRSVILRSTSQTQAAWESYNKELLIKGVRLGTTEEGLRGVFATGAVGGSDLQKSDPLVSVPGNLVFEVTNTRPPVPFPNFLSQKLWEECMWDQRLAFLLLHEQFVVGEGSEKAFWLKQLPVSYSTPLHWDPEVLSQEVQYPALAGKVEKQREEWKALYEKWKGDSSTSSSIGKVGFDDFVRALECVNSRAFSGTYEGSNAGQRQSLLLFTGALTLAFPLLNFGTWEQSLSAALAVGLSIIVRDVFFSRASGLKRYVVCPFVDMFNHMSTASSDVSYNYFTNVFELRTESFSSGEQVFISYGKQSNDRLLQMYGFVDCDNPFDVYDFGQGVLEVLLRSGDDLPPIPDEPSPQQRLTSIADALRITEVEDATVRGSKRGPPLRGDEVPVRFFRIAPGIGGAEALGVEGILKAAAVRKGEGVAGTIARFDSVSTRAIRALYSTPQEWKSLTDSANKIGNLEKLGTPLCSATEAKVANALRSIASLELASKSTDINQDLALFETLKQKRGSATQGSPNNNSKGFSSAPAKTSTAAAAAAVPNPSGPYQDALFSALAFRIEKKKLLLEAIQ